MEDIDQIIHNTSWRLKTVATMLWKEAMTQSRIVTESTKGTVPQTHYMFAQSYELTRLRAKVEPVAQRQQETGLRSGSVTTVTPGVDDDKDG